jgi:three-Cys-motif partner protein
LESVPDWIDEIGYWSELKIEIIRKYAAAYSTILAKQRLHHIYVDAFAGGGGHKSRTTGQMVKGSPLAVLDVQPPFEEYHFIDLDPRLAAALRRAVVGRRNVYVYEDDCNEVLVPQIVPRCRYEDFRRALWVLDPKGMHYQWKIVAAAGRAQTVDLLLNFPIMDINRNALRRDTARIADEARARMDAFWGDESWMSTAYVPQEDLFGEEHQVKLSNRTVVDGYCRRLTELARFAHVAQPLPMRNSTGAEVYYLLFASRQEVAVSIMNGIFAKYRREGFRPGSADSEV